MTAQQARWRVLRHLISLLFTLSLVAVFALALWRVRPETFAMWLASLLVAVHLAGDHAGRVAVHPLPHPQGRRRPRAATPLPGRRTDPFNPTEETHDHSKGHPQRVRAPRPHGLADRGCSDDENPLTGTTRTADRVETRDFDAERLASILNFITEDEVVDLARREYPEDVEKGAVPLGSEYYAHVWRPDLVEAWVFAMTYDPPVPVCDGSGLGFIRCVKRYLDDGRTASSTRRAQSITPICGPNRDAVMLITPGASTRGAGRKPHLINLRGGCP